MFTNVVKLGNILPFCCRNNMEVFLKHSAVLQVAMAVVNTVENKNCLTLEELQSTEKVRKIKMSFMNSKV